MNSRDEILNKLRAAPKPFPDIEQQTDYVPMSPIIDQDQSVLRDRFIHEAELLSCNIHQPQSNAEATKVLLDIIGEDKRVASWDMDQIPFQPLAAVLHEQSITVTEPADPDARVGITGADAALAATGSVVLAAGPGKYREPSLLPSVHIVLVAPDSILPNLESWMSLQREEDLEAFRSSSNIVVISGASRTADIAMELILGMHGPKSVHIIILPE